MNARSAPARFDRARSSATAFLLEQDGFCLARDLAAPSVRRVAAELDRHFDDTPFCAGDFYGERTKRFGRLLVRSPSMCELVMNPVILTVAQQILGPHCDAIQLNVTQAIEIHPGALAQFPHRDQDMWPGADNAYEFLINVIWPLTPFTEDNGATLLWPRSHGGHDVEPEAAAVASVSDPGDAIIFLGSTLHGAGANLSNTTRRAIVVGYSLGWLKPYENPWLAYPPEIARDFPRGLAELAGYHQHRPNLGNFEGQCPSVLLQDDRPERLGAVDALRPDQAAALADFVAHQLLGASPPLAGPVSHP
ncbi:phytanoyl-CoA dioxygenase family protein [Sphingomonas oryzagri]